MTKTKAQLRAEAVERLKDCRYHTLADYVRAMLGWGHEPHFEDSRDALIDLLTDDCGPCYSCSKLAELRAENNALHVKLDEQERADVSQAVEDTAERVTNKGEMLHDSREKLEADVREKIVYSTTTAMWPPSANTTTEHVHTTLDVVLGWLDRQSAITERHILTHPDERDEQIAELQARVNELTIALESAHAKNRSLRTHISKMQEGRHGWHVKGAELQREVDRLTRENISLARDLGECMAERDALVAEIDALEYKVEL